MNKLHSLLPWQTFGLISILGASSSTSFGQPEPTNTFVPVVTVRATDPFASESGDTGTFTLFREGSTNETLNVYCLYGGTASNGVDYATLPNFITIPAGARTTPVVVKPIDDALVEGTETVELRLSPSPMANPVNYIIGNPSNAVVYIADNDRTNIPPLVRIISPANETIFRAPVDVPIFAFARDPDDLVASVEFFAGTNSLGFGTVLPCISISTCATCPTICPSNYYRLVWTNAPIGTHILTAQATDSRGAVGLSEPVKIAILPLPPPPTNRPPIVNILATDPIAIEGTNCWPWLGLANPLPAWSNWVSSAAAFRFFTNCGPKNATFTVHRFGATNDPVTIDYAIGGTASNGVDYVTLPGSVTVPAGERSAQITVVPIDDGPPDITSTVILKLKPDTNYVIGFPPQAAAIIIDSDRPRSGTSVLPGLSFHVNATGPDGAWFHIESSADLVNWTSLCTNQVVNGSIDFIDPDTQANQSRFYRTVPEAGPPPE